MTIERLKQGYPTTITISSYWDSTGPNVTFWEKTVQPPGIDGGEPIDTTTMRNTAVRTKSPPVLYDMTPLNCNVAYDPTVYDSIMSAINKNAEIVVVFPDGATLTFWGYLKSFTPQDITDTNEPVAAITIVPTNVNNDDEEKIPVVETGAGTPG